MNCSAAFHRGIVNGISDPYEAAEDAEIVIDTSHLSLEDAAQHILLYLERQGYISVNGNNGHC